MIGRILSNRYKLVAELGSGGMAWVYLAEDLVKERKVAVKVLYPQHSQDLAFLQRFIREAKLSMALSQAAPQKNIVQLLDYGADRDTHYLVMEYVQGQDLAQRLEAEGALPWRVALDLARQVALALEHAHCHDIVHRDIKPSNIMVLDDGTVRVLDFGIARARTSPEVTLSGFVGSPNYAAPEQATGKKVDIRADIYSLGVVLYRMLGGRLPFQGDTPWEVINLHISATPPPLEALRPGLPNPVVDLVGRALAKRPEDRFQTPAQMVAAIKSVLAGEHVAEVAPDCTGVGGELVTAAAQAGVVGLLGVPGQPEADLVALYDDAVQAIEAEQWQEAVDLLSRCLKVDPDYRDVSERLSAVGRQIQLAALYRSARRALERGQWQKALQQLSAIAAIDPDYKEIADLRGRAEREERLPPGGQDAGADFPTQADVELAALDVAGTVGDNGQAGGRARPAAAARPEADGRQGQRRWGLLIGVPLALLFLVALGYLYFGDGSLLGSLAAGQRPSASTTATARASLAPSATWTAISSTATAAPSASSSDTLASPAGPSATSPVASTASVQPGTPAAADLTATAAVAGTANITGTAAVTLTAGGTPTLTATVEDPGSSPEAPSGRIAFARFDPGGNTYNVHVCRVDGSNCRRVATEASQPDFLPGGTRLVVHSWKSDAKGLFLIDRSGNPIWQISNQIEAARPSVDFQGEAYVYHSRQEADRQPRLYRTYSAEIRPLVREGSAVRGRSPSWTPDGKILYAGCLGDACGIILVGPHGGDPRQVVAGASETNPEASPDGRWVAFMSQRDGNWEVYVATLAGGRVQRLTNYSGNDGLPAWSPGGRWLAYVSDRGGAWAVWAVRFDDSGQASAPVRLFAIGGPLDGQVRGAAPHEIHGWLEERISWGE